MDRVKHYFGMVKETLSNYSKDEVPRLGAALAYYTVFSIAPVLVIAVAVATLVWGADAATGHLKAELGNLMGDAGSDVIVTAVEKSRDVGGGVLATVIGFVTLIVGASGAFLELQTSLNRVWKAETPTGKGLWFFFRRRLISFGMVLSIGFLMIVSTILTALLKAASDWAGGLLTSSAVALQFLNVGVSFVVITTLFALIYKVLPDAKIAWGDVWVGAAVTSVLFQIGKLAIGLYIGHSSIASTYGAAGSLVALLVWIYYSAQILLLGAEFTKVWAAHHGSRSDEKKPGADEKGYKQHVRPHINPAQRRVSAG